MHSNVEPLWVDVKLTVALVSFVGFGVVSVTDVSGATVSTVKVVVAAVASVLPAGSIARTLIVCEPSASPEYVFELVQVEYPPASSWHWKVDPASVAENVTVAEVFFVAVAGAESIEVSGAVRSTVKVIDAGVASVLPAASVALT
ncbi:unannotated protein [freshwater metagenome]|uniref:Unannotated protein n=1 Tax=freshwater metagenome TaxID=449393 RepID=A0A6J7H3G4_9ZZZZ|nr:hypothetical protein [Actinomycetota bacterium]